MLFFSICRIVGDNWDLEVKARYQTKSQNNKSLHYFHAYAVKDRVAAQGLDNKRPQKSIDEIEMRVSTNTRGAGSHSSRPGQHYSKGACEVSYTLQYIQEGSHLPHPSSTL